MRIGDVDDPSGDTRGNLFRVGPAGVNVGAAGQAVRGGVLGVGGVVVRREDAAARITVRRDVPAPRER